ncbi:MAG: MBL fold metallo-hydrolase [Deltaproteobacteria bacterium]|nr:MBL fold metallo-hydrolase [Deltaproteobacteria bacterium]
MFDFEKGRVRYIKGGKYPQCHTVFIDDEIRVLIDPACDAEKLKPIQSEKSIDIVINSHCHEDHFLNNYLFPEAQLWVPALEADFYLDIRQLIDAWTYAEPANKEYRENIKKNI